MLLVTKTSTRYKVLRTVCHCGSVCVVAELPCAAFNFFNLFTFLLTKFQKCLTYYLSLTGCLNTSSEYCLFRLPCQKRHAVVCNLQVLYKVVLNFVCVFYFGWICTTYCSSLTGCLNTSSEYRLFRLPCQNTACRCCVATCKFCTKLFWTLFVSFTLAEFLRLNHCTWQPCYIHFSVFTDCFLQKVNNFKYFSIFSLNNALLCKMSKSCLISRFGRFTLQNKRRFVKVSFSRFVFYKHLFTHCCQR